MTNARDHDGTRWKRWLRALPLAWLALACPRDPAWAHAMLLASEPAEGAVLHEAPREIVLRFNEPVTPIRAQVFNRAGRALVLPMPPRTVDNEVRIPLPDGLAAGGYLVSFRVVSADSHPVGGSFLFSVGSAPEFAPSPAPTPDGTETGWNIASAVNRAIHYLALLMAAGGILFLALVADCRPNEDGATRHGIGVMAALAGLTAVLGVGLQGAVLLAVSTGGIADPAAWRLGAESTVGRSAAVALAGLALLTINVRYSLGSASLALAIAGAAIALLSLAATGHAATAPPRWLTAPIVVLHGLAVAFWIGSLGPLARTLRQDDLAVAAARVERFSRLAVPAVILLAATGVVIAVVQVRDPAALVATGYGRVLLLKLAVVSLLILIAADNKRRLTPAFKAGDPAARRKLVRNIRVEIALAAVVLATTSALGSIPPPRAQNVVHAAAHHVAIAAGKYTASIRIESVAGRAALTVRLATAASGGALDPREVLVQLAQPDVGIEPMARTLRRAGPGEYRYQGPELSLPGRWRVTIEALIDNFEKTTFTADLPAR